MTSSHRLASTIVMGINDHRQCHHGWYVREKDGRNGVICRWTGAEAAFALRVPAGASLLRLMVWGPSVLTGKPVGFSLFAGGQRFKHVGNAINSDFWKLVDIDLGMPAQTPENEMSPEGSTGAAIFRGDTDRDQLFLIRPEEQVMGRGADPEYQPCLYVPDHHLRNGDHRVMGIKIAAIRVV